MGLTISNVWRLLGWLVHHKFVRGTLTLPRFKVEKGYNSVIQQIMGRLVEELL